MQMPRLDDTIVAVSSAWEPSALAIVRLSGPQANEIAAMVIPDLVERSSGRRAEFLDAALLLGDACGDESSPAPMSGTKPGLRLGVQVPATMYRFLGPHSYTGQDVIELHVPGSLPLLRRVCEVLIACGARRALPGEFTARAFLNGRIDAVQVEGVLGLITASDEAAAREAARAAQRTDTRRIASISEKLAELLARVEAGIDFADEEDVSFVTSNELLATIQAMIRTLARTGRHFDFRSAALPHVTFAGLPNAGKSTLFNALLGHQRAIVSPVLGTTRDTLSATVEIGGQSLILQDAAGLGDSRDELDAAAHLAAETSQEQADLVLWVHDRSRTWALAEAAACERISPQRQVLVLSKGDRPAAQSNAYYRALSFERVVEVCAVTSRGLDQLRSAIGDAVASVRRRHETTENGPAYEKAHAALLRAARLVTPEADGLRSPDLVAFELRTAWQAIQGARQTDLVEDLLGRIYTRFCVGK